MNGAQGPSAREFLLSHHIPARYDRTLSLCIGTRRVHLCARCSGQLLGGLAFVVLFFTIPEFRTQLFTPPYQLLIGIGPLGATVDWLTQSVGQRKSRNPVRVLTGALLGFTLVDALSLILTERWLDVIAAGIIFLAYAIVIVAVLVRSNAIEAVVAEHFPR